MHNSKTIAFRVMSLVLQLHLVMMSKYSKFGDDTFNTFWVVGYIKALHDDDNDYDDLAITIAGLKSLKCDYHFLLLADKASSITMATEQLYIIY